MKFINNVFQSVLIMAVTMAPQIGQAGEGGDVGNGGDAVICGKNAYLYDLIDAKTKVGIEPSLGAPHLPWESKVEIALSRLDRVQKNKADLLRSYFASFKRETEWTKNTLLDVPDTGVGQIPFNCEPQIYQAAFQREASTDLFSTGKRYTISEFIWNKMDNDNKASLVLHELALRWYGIGTRDTSDVRYFTAYLVSDQFPKTNAEYYQFIKKLRFNSQPYQVGNCTVKSVRSIVAMDAATDDIAAVNDESFNCSFELAGSLKGSVRSGPRMYKPNPADKMQAITPIVNGLPLSQVEELVWFGSAAHTNNGTIYVEELEQEIPFLSLERTKSGYQFIFRDDRAQLEASSNKLESILVGPFPGGTDRNYSYFNRATHSKLYFDHSGRLTHIEVDNNIADRYLSVLIHDQLLKGSPEQMSILKYSYGVLSATMTINNGQVKEIRFVLSSHYLINDLNYIVTLIPEGNPLLGVTQFQAKIELVSSEGQKFTSTVDMLDSAKRIPLLKMDPRLGPVMDLPKPVAKPFYFSTKLSTLLSVHLYKLYGSGSYSVKLASNTKVCAVLTTIKTEAGRQNVGKFQPCEKKAILLRGDALIEIPNSVFTDLHVANSKSINYNYDFDSITVKLSEPAYPFNKKNGRVRPYLKAGAVLQIKSTKSKFDFTYSRQK